MPWELLLAQFVAGISSAGVLFLLGSGLSLVFGVSRVVNMAHGSFFLLGGFLAAWILESIGHAYISFWVALVGVPIIVAFVGVVVEIVGLRPVYALPHQYQLLLTFAVIYIFGDVMKVLWGAKVYCSARPELLTGSVLVFGFNVPIYSLFTLGMAGLAGGILWVVLYKTRLGKLIRAVEQDRDMSAALGIDTGNVSTLVFAIGTGLAALSGVVASGAQGMIVGLDVEVIIPAFIVVIIGGMGSLTGAAVGSIIIGLVGAFGLLVLPKLSILFLYIVMIMVLVSRPWGLFGKPL